MKRLISVLSLAMVMFCSSDALAKSEIVSSFYFGNKVQDIAVDGSGMIYATIANSSGLWNGDFFKLQFIGDQLQKISSLRGNGYQAWDAFTKISILNGYGYVLSDYYNSPSAVVNLSAMTALFNGIDWDLNDPKSISNDGAGLYIGGGSENVPPYLRSYLPLPSSGELSFMGSRSLEAIPERAFSQMDKKYLFLAMSDAGIAIWDTTNPGEPYKLGQPRKEFYSASGYITFSKAIDMVAEGQYVYALAGDAPGWRGVLAIISLTDPSYVSTWFSLAKQASAMDLEYGLLFMKKSGNRIYIATKTNILIVDVSVVTAPRLVEKIAIIANAIEVVGDKLLVADGYHVKVVKLIDPIAGDVNADNEVDLSDAILSLQVTAGKNVTVDVAGDVNGDKKIGLPEAIHALQKTAGLK
jgi:hypothetical protein